MADAATSQAVLIGDAASGTAARPRWPVVLFRATATAYALAAAAQPLLAGLLLSGSFSALKAHEVTGQAVGGLGILTLICAILLWQVGGGSVAAVRISGGLLVGVVLQIILGYDRLLALHVPLGVAMVAGIGRLALFAWREAGK
jgi:hypothetical protein